jgi:hypothetical protein
VYLGLPLLVLAAAAAWRLRKTTAARTAAIIGAASLVLSLGGRLRVLGHQTQIPLPFLPFTKVPLLENMIPARLSVFTLLAVAMLVGLLIQDIAHLAVRSRRLWLAGLACALVVVIPTAPPASTLHYPAFFSNPEAIPAGSNVLFAPFSNNNLPMAAQVENDFRYKLPQGALYTPDGFTPGGGAPDTALFNEILAVEHGWQPEGKAARCDGSTSQRLTAPCRAVLVSDLRRLRIDAVVIIDDAEGADDVAALFASLYGSPPVRTGGVRLWTQPPPAT